jgi:UDP-N-acetylglucosamine 2-epimerase
MYDNSLHFSTIADAEVAGFEAARDRREAYVLATLHRDSNTDNPQRLNAILEAFKELSKEITIVLPMHPRTRKMAGDFHADNIIVTEPVSFLEMIQLERHAQLILTDSGGVQKESYFFRKPCVILRSETEWVEIVETGAATLADADTDKILEASHHYLQQPPVDFPEIFGDGHAAEFMLEKILECL